MAKKDGTKRERGLTIINGGKFGSKERFFQSQERLQMCQAVSRRQQ
jgi:hypothetical protein